MKNIFVYIACAFGLVSCTDDLKDATDFTSVENPFLFEESIVGEANSSTVWLAGVDRELSLALNEILVLAELGSDNYVNTQTFYSQFLDELEIRTDDPDMRDTQFRISRLREAAQFGLTQVGPNDSEYSSDTEAEYYFFEGMSYMYAGLYFSNLPQEELGPTVSSSENLASAINSFEQAISLNADKPEYHLAKARVHYYLGDRERAVGAALQALSISENFIRSAQYDEAITATNGRDLNNNVFESALYQRATFDDLQPLPSLDFLDPKYSEVDQDVDAPVNYLKAEEALLILAEANLSNSNIDAAKQNLRDLLQLVSTREVRSIDDTIEGRTQIQPGSRPDSTNVVVNGRSNLVLYRGAGTVDIPSISGTSLTEADIDNLENDDESLEILYRTRQEIFIAEGIRFVDMGIKLVIHENEILQNPNISFGDPGTLKEVPSFIESVASDLDVITYNDTTGIATTKVDVNEILVDNKSSDDVVPFF